MTNESMPTDPVPGDPWLDSLLAEILARHGGKPVLELGCGEGLDSAVLAAAGCRLVGVDISEPAIAQARLRVPGGEFHCQDLRAPFPVEPGGTNVLIASLSLHYFSWSETAQLVQRIRSVLAPGGLLLCRLNSTNDRNYGAVGFPEIEQHYYLVNGQPKRFFSQDDIERLFASGWRIRTLAEEVIHRYKLPKVIWRVVADSLQE